MSILIIVILHWIFISQHTLSISFFFFFTPSFPLSFQQLWFSIESGSLLLRSPCFILNWNPFSIHPLFFTSITIINSHNPTYTSITIRNPKNYPFLLGNDEEEDLDWFWAILSHKKDDKSFFANMALSLNWNVFVVNSL